jgi:iron complex transport system substrate-binding protein
VIDLRREGATLLFVQIPAFERQVFYLPPFQVLYYKDGRECGMFTKTKAFAACVLLIAIATTGCFDGNSDIQPPKNASGITEEPYMIITDFWGRDITIKKPPQRIVSLAPSCTEILFALGAGDRVVGVTDYDDYPEQVKDLPKLGDFEGPNLEAIVAQDPDIVLASSLSGKESMDALENLGITVAVLEARKIEQIYRSIELLGQMTASTVAAEELISDMKGAIEDIVNKASGLPKPKVFYLVDLTGNFSAGSGTFIDELITIAGGINIAGDTQGWVQYSIEKLVEMNPEIIIAAPHSGNIESLENLAGYRETDAVKNGRIYVISDDNIISRSSYRIVQGLKEIFGYLHPDTINN